MEKLAVNDVLVIVKKVYGEGTVFLIIIADLEGFPTKESKLLMPKI